jgi:hypothetical protein
MSIFWWLITTDLNGLVSVLSIIEAFTLRYTIVLCACLATTRASFDILTLWYLRFCLKISIARRLLLIRSVLLILTIILYSAIYFYEACSNSPKGEFRIMLTPLLFVAFRMLSLKDLSWELKTWLRGMLWILVTNLTFSLLLTVT